MKTSAFTTLLLIWVSFGFGTLKAQNFDNAQAYQDYILAAQAEIVDRNIAYLSQSLHDHKARQNEEERQEIVKQLDEAIAKVEIMPSFKNDNTLKNAALSVFNTYKETYQIELKKAEAQTVGKQTPYEEMKAHFDLQEKAEEKLLAVGKEFIKIQKKFARDHKLTRQEDQIECLFTKVVEVNHYCRKVYLTFMQVNEHNSAFFEAMKNKQIESMEKSRAALIEVAEKALVEMEKLHAFDGHTAYIEQAMALTNFLQEKAKNEFVEIIKINQNKKATFEDSNRFNKMVIGFYKDSKKMTNKFHDASGDLLENYVSTEAYRTEVVSGETVETEITEAKNTITTAEKKEIVSKEVKNAGE